MDYSGNLSGNYAAEAKIIISVGFYMIQRINFRRKLGDLNRILDKATTKRYTKA